MAEVVRARSFEVGWRAAPPHVRRALLRALTAMAEAPTPAMLRGDAEITLWVPTELVLVEHVVPNTGWSMLYRVDPTGFILRFLCETPPR